MTFDTSSIWFELTCFAAVWIVTSAGFMLIKAGCYYAGKIRDQSELKAKRVEAWNLRSQLECAERNYEIYFRQWKEGFDLLSTATALLEKQKVRIETLNAEVDTKQTRIVELETRLHDLLKKP